MKGFIKRLIIYKFIFFILTFGGGVAHAQMFFGSTWDTSQPVWNVETQQFETPQSSSQFSGTTFPSQNQILFTPAQLFSGSTWTSTNDNLFSGSTWNSTSDNLFSGSTWNGSIAMFSGSTWTNPGNVFAAENTMFSGSTFN